MTENKNIKLRLISAVICTLMVIAAAVCAGASEFPGIEVSKNDGTGYAAIIYDGADLLTESEEAELLTEMMDVTSYSTAIFVTCSESHTDSIQKYARYYLESICSDQGLSGYTAVIYMVDMYSRELVIYSGETVFKTITTGLANTITDNTYTYASAGDYKGCASEAFSQIYKVLDGQKIAQPMRYISAALLAIFAGLAITLIIVRKKTVREQAGNDEIINALILKNFDPGINSRLINSKKVKRVEVTFTDGGGGGGFSGGGGGFSGGGGSSGGGGFSGSGGGGSHKF